MASSSVSQDDVDADFEICSRRSRIRTARARNINPAPTRTGDNEGDEDVSDKESGGVHSGHFDHDASPKPASRVKEKRTNRPIHVNKGKQQRDRRKLREKRRSTGVVQLYSTESTGGSTGEDDEELLTMNAETRRNTHFNENLEKKEKEKETNPMSLCEHRHKKPSFTSLRNKRFSPSDLDADDEDNQDYDSLTMSDSTLSLVQPSAVGLGIVIPCEPAGVPPSAAPLTATRPTNGRPATPIADSIDEQLERACAENRRLLSLMEEKDKRITTLENKVGQLSFELTQANNEKSNLRQENSALIRAMASLSTK